jgi:hypothetical protein
MPASVQDSGSDFGFLADLALTKVSRDACEQPRYEAGTASKDLRQQGVEADDSIATPFTLSRALDRA